MGTAVVVLLLGIWAVVLLPKVLGNRRSASPTFSTRRFSQSMQALGSPGRGDPSYAALLRLTGQREPVAPAVPQHTPNTGSRSQQRPRPARKSSPDTAQPNARRPSPHRSTVLEQRRRQVLARMTAVAGLALILAMTARGVFVVLAIVIIAVWILYVAALTGVESGVRLDRPLGPQLSQRHARPARTHGPRARRPSPRLVHAFIRS